MTLHTSNRTCVPVTPRDRATSSTGHGQTGATSAPQTGNTKERSAKSPALFAAGLVGSSSVPPGFEDTLSPEDRARNSLHDSERKSPLDRLREYRRTLDGVDHEDENTHAALLHLQDDLLVKEGGRKLQRSPTAKPLLETVLSESILDSAPHGGGEQADTLLAAAGGAPPPGLSSGHPKNSAQSAERNVTKNVTSSSMTAAQENWPLAATPSWFTGVPELSPTPYFGTTGMHRGAPRWSPASSMLIGADGLNPSTGVNNVLPNMNLPSPSSMVVQGAPMPGASYHHQPVPAYGPHGMTPMPLPLPFPPFSPVPLPGLHHAYSAEAAAAGGVSIFGSQHPFGAETGMMPPTGAGHHWPETVCVEVESSESTPEPETAGAARAKKEYLKTIICLHYMKGNCSKGDQCRFKHPSPEELEATGMSRYFYHSRWRKFQRTVKARQEKLAKQQADEEAAAANAMKLSQGREGANPEDGQEATKAARVLTAGHEEKGVRAPGSSSSSSSTSSSTLPGSQPAQLPLTAGEKRWLSIECGLAAGGIIVPGTNSSTPVAVPDVVEPKA
ncbi:unnamed protein product [Amoebophrya sp. A25]|nr:unnamed protein product [Amoebophrya sp. A25]|eukprot:GSA25T00009870001.1